MAKVKYCPQKGEKFGRLAVFGDVFHDARRRRVVECRCECGGLKVAPISDLRGGKVTSCGCARRLASKATGHENKKHGATTGRRRTPTYVSWQSMIMRCHSPQAAARWPGYVGIAVCSRWRGEGGFANFASDMGERPEGATLDRIDGSGDYTPGNCRWSSYAEQMRNRKNSVIIEHDGKRLSAAEWAREVGTHRNNILRRLKRGLPLNEVLKP